MDNKFQIRSDGNGYLVYNNSIGWVQYFRTYASAKRECNKLNAKLEAK